MNTPHISSPPRRTPLSAWRLFLAVGMTLFSLCLCNSQANAATLIFGENQNGGFELGNLTNFNCSGNCPTVVNSPVFSGSKAGNFDLNRNTSPVPYRTEVAFGTTGQFAFDQEYWFGFSYRYVDWPNDSDREMAPFQIHATASSWDAPCQIGPAVGTAPFYMASVNGNVQFNTYGGINRATWPVEIGQWTHIIVRFKISFGSGGYVQAWKNGIQLFSITGANSPQFDKCDKPMRPAYLKMGIYKWSWKDGLPATGTTHRQLVIDNIKIASGTSGYALVDPTGGGGTAPSAPTGLTASAPTSSTINLNWTDTSSNETGFEIDRATNSAFTTGPAPITNAYTTGANPTMPFTVGALSSGTLYYFRVRATNASGDSTNSNTASATTSAGGSSPTLYEAESLAYTNSDTAAITPDEGASNGNYVMLNGTGTSSFISYTVDVVTAGTYNITTGITTRSNRGIYQLKIDGVNQGAAQNYYAAGATTLFEERDLGTKTLPAGTHSFRFECTGKDALAGQFKQGLDYIKLTNQSANSVPVITTTTIPGTIAGESYSQALAATGGDGALVWSVSAGALPAGLSLSSGGVISGSATTAGTANFTVKVADSDGVTGAGDEDTQALSIVVTANSVPVITTTALPAGIVGTSYSQSLAATGGNGTLVWSVSSGTLPAGLSLSSAGVISGTPTTAATSNFTVKVADSDGVTGAGDEDTQALSIAINVATSVSVSATDTNASETALDPGTFTFTRTGSTAAALTVNFTVSGSATGATDYTSLGTSVSFAIGSATAIKTVTPVQDASVEGNETAIVTLATGSGYTIGSPNAATVTIADNDFQYEAESLAFTNSNTATITPEAGASNGNYVLLNGSGTSSFISYTVNVATAGTYTISLGLTERSNRGIYQLLIDGANQGAAQDSYEPGTLTLFPPAISLGTKVLSAGNHTFRFNCTGKNASASQYKQGLDYIRLTQ